MRYIESINYYLFHSVVFFLGLIFLKSVRSFFFKKKYSDMDKKLVKIIFILCCLFSLTSLLNIQEFNHKLLISLTPAPFFVSFFIISDIDGYKAHRNNSLASFLTIMIIGISVFYKINLNVR